jgi:hypothetical protein
LPRRHRIGGRPDRLDVIEREIDDEVRTRFPGVAVRQVALLQYGDDPGIEPGDLWVRVLLDSGGSDDHDRSWRAFTDGHQPAIDAFPRYLAEKVHARSEAIRWALDRFREQPAYERVRERASDAIEREIEDEAKSRFPDGVVHRVLRLQYGDDPEIEPGDLWVRVVPAAEGPDDWVTVTATAPASAG